MFDPSNVAIYGIPVLAVVGATVLLVVLAVAGLATFVLTRRPSDRQK